MGVHMPNLPEAVRGMPRWGSLPSTSDRSGAAQPLPRPCRNRTAASEMRKHWRAHGNGLSVHMHPVV